MCAARVKNGGRDDQVAVVKKYANRRLYNTATSSYVTLDELSKMVRAGDQFVVFDAKSGEDLTRSVLTQIILEEDSKGRNLLPISFLRQLISYYDDSLRAFLPRYLELSMDNFIRNQEQIRRYIEGTFGSFFPVGQFEDMARQNRALFQKAAHIFTPPGGSEEETPAATEREAGADPATLRQIDQLNAKIDALEKQIGQLAAERDEER
ncbi:MAG: polyhydroxyalkanoate synthesis repressor PhaR [Geminicoccaceae bacterium]|nr:polyhydroxyalkanoate synthesis repressor PhaR [Geminicoccaceae bacterium]